MSRPALGPLRSDSGPGGLPGGQAPPAQEREGEPEDGQPRQCHNGQRHHRGQDLTGASGGPGALPRGPGPDSAPLADSGQVSHGRLESGRPDAVSRRGRNPGRGGSRVVGPVSRAEGGHRPGDQEDGEQPGPDQAFGPVGGPAQRIAVQPERTGQPREATWPARPGFHSLTAAQPLIHEMASTQSSISEILTNLNMTNNPSPSHTNTTAPEIAAGGQESIAIGLLASALGGLAAVGKIFCDREYTLFGRN